MLQCPRRISRILCATALIGAISACRSSQNVTTEAASFGHLDLTADSSAIECDTTTWYIFQRNVFAPVARSIRNKRTNTRTHKLQDNNSNQLIQSVRTQKRRDDATSNSCRKNECNKKIIMAIVAFVALLIAVVTFFRKK